MNRRNVQAASIDAVVRVYRHFRPWRELSHISMTATWFLVAFGLFGAYAVTADPDRVEQSGVLRVVSEWIDSICWFIEDVFDLDDSPPARDVALWIAGFGWLYGTFHAYLSTVVAPRAYLLASSTINLLPVALGSLVIALGSAAISLYSLIDPDFAASEDLANVPIVALVFGLIVWMTWSPLRCALVVASAPGRARRLALGARPEWTHPVKLRAIAAGMPIGLLYLPRRRPARFTLWIANVLRAPLFLLVLATTLALLFNAPEILEEVDVTELRDGLGYYLFTSEGRHELWDDEDIRRPLLGTAVILSIWLAGGLLARLARRLSIASFSALSAADTRPPVLFLRAFQDDQGQVRRRRGSLFDRLVAAPEAHSIDEMLLCDHYFRGPVLAIADGRRQGLPYGATRRGIADTEDWFDVVAKLAATAVQCVIVAETSDGVRREAGLLAQHAGKTIVLSSPRLDAAAANDALRDIASRIYGAGDFPPLPPGRRIIALFPCAGGLQCLIGSDSRAETYRLALRIAMYRQLAAPASIRGEGPDDPMPEL